MKNAAHPCPRPRVVVSNRIYPETLAALGRFADTEANSGPEPWSGDELLARCREADGLLAFMTDRIDGPFLECSPPLRIIACALKGADNFDLAAARQRNVAVSVVPDLLTEPTAELAIGLLIALGRNIVAGDRFVRAGGFRGWRPNLYGVGLAGAKVGLLGLGQVGRAVARRLAGFGCRLIGHEPAAPPPPEVLAVSFNELLSASDAIVLALPLTGQTRHLIGQEALAAIQPTALLVNVARGSLVDEAAVAEALEQERLGGYAADVFEMEDWALPDRPREISPRLLAHPRTVFTPHLGSAVAETRRAIEAAAVDALEAFFAGRPVPGRVV